MEIFTTMITPFTKDGGVDYETAKKYVDFYFESGIDGIFAVCQSSEIFYLSLEERVKLNRLVYERAKELEKKSGKTFTVVSSGHVSDSIEDQARAQSLLCSGWIFDLYWEFHILCECLTGRGESAPMVRSKVAPCYLMRLVLDVNPLGARGWRPGTSGTCGLCPPCRDTVG